MEVVEEPVVHNSTVEGVQVSVSDESEVLIASDAGESHQSNGVAEFRATADPEFAAPPDTAIPDLHNADSTVAHEIMSVETTKSCEPTTNETHITSEIVSEVVDSTTDTVNCQNTEKQSDNGLASKIDEEISELFVESTENIITHGDLPVSEECLIDHNTDPKDMVQFKTEILVERNENDVNETDQTDVNSDELDASKHILSELRQNLELSDVLHSEGVDNMENNNGSTRQEVLNKEELLDILEGNDVDQADDQYVKIMQVDHSNIKTVEAQMALQQLTRLKSSKQKRSIERIPRKKKGEKRLSQNNSNISEIKSKSDKTSEASADESEIILDQNKGKKDKRTTSSKTLEITAPDSKTSKKDKKSSEISPGGEEMAPVENAKSKKEKLTSELTADEIGSLPLDTKSKRGRKTVDASSKVFESTASENKGKKENILSGKSNAELSRDDDISESESSKSNSVKEDIVNVLVRDWEDDDHEPLKDVTTENLLQETENLVKSTEQPAVAQEVVVEQEHIDGSYMDSSTSFVSESQTALNKSGDESQPQRRLGRVIKKKVIFDPDNPDTFTKGKLANKNKETFDKEQPVLKKSKLEVQQMPKAKSPPGKLHWKKPPPKASKQNKRLTEVDRLLMDEGAVNMIYQLTPEAPKGKKNMRTKAEFIKKIQSSTPETKEMKFRERKKENIKGEEAEAKKIAGGKQRGSLSSSVKSMSVCEDFEAHSADDSIIYRRHSSSSYSSNCMSPLRVNELDSAGAPGAARVSRQPSDSQNLSIADEESVDQISDVFMTDMNTSSPTDVINKTDCLSIKQKLNSKLSHVLSKRKRESTKTDKPAKQKRLSAKNVERKEINVKSEAEQGLSKLKTLTVTLENSLAEISVKSKGDKLHNIQTLRDLDAALAYVDRMDNIAVTLLTSECGTLCSSLDLSSVLDDDMETRTTNAFSYAEAIRSLLSTAEQHSKLLCCGVWGACSGVGLALAALSDVAVASECARFALEAARAPVPLATVAFTSHIRHFPKSLLDSLIVFGNQLSAAEALSGGLLSRVLWPVRVEAQLRQLARDIASRPSGGLLLKKQLLTLNRGEKTFQSCLEVERDLLADYWVSAEGQRLLRAARDAP